ncbi:MAG: AAA family ATPase [Elusimicrobia bacterium]|nr:AAA family ATPase [Elusimicrobiota bacterium]
MEHFERLLRLLDVEREAEWQENKRELARYPLEVREALGKTATRLTFAGTDTGVGNYPLLSLTRHLREGDPSPFHAMDSGDIVQIVFPDGAGVLDGTLYKVEDAAITIALNKELPRSLPSGPYQVDLLGSDATYRRMAEALTRVDKERLGVTARLRDIFLGDLKPRIGKPAKVNFLNESLNEFQRRAVETALGAPEVAIIHGPPGTGKTTVLVEIIRQAVQQKLRILAGAPSNIAVDNILEKLLACKIRAVRLGHPARISEALRHATLDALIAHDPVQNDVRKMRQEFDRMNKRDTPRGDLFRLKKEIRAMEKDIFRSVLRSAQVVLSTHGGLNLNMFRENFDLVVLDEASQSTEPLSWIPLVKAKKAILAGDVCQLPPTIYSQEAAREGLAVTLLERLKTTLPKGLQALLRVQYRMHEAIMGFSSQQFYEGKLIADESVKTHLLSDLPNTEASELTTQPLIYIDTAGAGFEETWNELLESRENKGEADLAVRLYQKLRLSGVEANQIAVITPYVAQVRLIKSLLKEPGLEIASIDAFQGREKEAIILSLVRSNDQNEVGFLSDTRRMNVGMTRARRLLIVIGDSASIAGHPFYAQFIDYAARHEAHRSSYEWSGQ